MLAAPPLGWLTALARQVRELIILVLLGAAVVTAVVGDLADTAVIMTVVVLNCTLGALQEVRSGRATDALADLTAPRATVIRDGRSRDIDVGEVVRGDAIRLSAGDIVPADARLSLAEAVQSDESMLTGENEPISKGPSALVYAGTVITHGRGEAVVTATADATAMGAIARSVRDSGQTQTPVQKQLAVLGKRLAWAAAAAAAGVATLNMIGGQSLETSLVLAVSLAVAAIPESLPAVVTLSLAMAARRMTSHGVLIKKLSAVEALGSVTIIATDKTGTLTTGRMSFAQAWTAHPDNADELRTLLESAVLCNDATAVTEGSSDGRTQRDDPTEVALIEAAAASGIDVPAVRAAYPRISEIPFDPITARMTTVHDVGSTRREICKGAPEAVRAEL